ncbi:unnamed protein product [Tetraodon nigroviridis]|uniref:(spotted green pufferfish) hypothetical protein n=1 Tax=Tetraodon nigroviridis TaxID=99883 RepID=Q4SEG2_TETNG|nr:unnamed protein product [Tetraodon nigroviridis]
MDGRIFSSTDVCSSVCAQDCEQIWGGLASFAALTRQLTFHLQQLHRRTEQELRNIQTRWVARDKLKHILGFKACQRASHPPARLIVLMRFQEIFPQLQGTPPFPGTTRSEGKIPPCSCRQLQASIAERLLQSERLVFQQEALSTLSNLLSQDLQRYREETHRLTGFTQRILRAAHRSELEEPCSMQEKNDAEQGSSMDNTTPPISNQTSNQTWKPEQKKPPAGLSLNLHRGGGIKDLISKFSVEDNSSYSGYLSNSSRRGRLHRAASVDVLDSPDQEKGPARLGSIMQVQRPIFKEFDIPELREVGIPAPSATIPTSEKTRAKEPDLAERNTKITQVEQHTEQTESKAAPTPQTTDSGNDSVADSGMGSESEMDLNKQPDSLSEEEPSTPRIVSASQNPKYQLFLSNDIKTNGESGKDADGPGGGESLRENGPKLARWETNRVGLNHYRGSLESLASRDLDASSDRVVFGDSLPRVFNSPYSANASLDYNPIHRMSEYRLQSGLSSANSEVNLFTRSTSSGNHSCARHGGAPHPNSPLYESMLRRRAELNNPMPPGVNTHYSMRSATLGGLNKKDYIEELTKQLDVSQKIEVKEARNVMVEANNQEYAFNYLQQSLNNKLQDAEETLDKQTQYTQTLSEKLWLVERQLEELQIDKDTKEKKSSELNSTILRLETELIDKEQTLEEEIQLRERIQLQCKQAERMVEDLKMELHTTNQAKDELAKQIKTAQEKMLDMESDLEELHDSEQRWAAKHKRAIEQTEQLQMKLIQEKDLNDHLEIEKATLERQLRELRLEVEDLHNSKVQEEVISRSESRVKELENTLRVEERNKAILNNTITKLERRINEINDQMEEEHRIATEQKDLCHSAVNPLDDPEDPIPEASAERAEEEASRKEAQSRHTQRELAEERETNARLQRQLLEQHLQTKYTPKHPFTARFSVTSTTTILTPHVSFNEQTKRDSDHPSDSGQPEAGPERGRRGRRSDRATG